MQSETSWKLWETGLGRGGACLPGSTPGSLQRHVGLKNGKAWSVRRAAWHFVTVTVLQATKATKRKHNFLSINRDPNPLSPTFRDSHQINSARAEWVSIFALFIDYLSSIDKGEKSCVFVGLTCKFGRRSLRLSEKCVLRRETFNATWLPKSQNNSSQVKVLRLLSGQIRTLTHSERRRTVKVMNFLADGSSKTLFHAFSRKKFAKRFDKSRKFVNCRENERNWHSIMHSHRRKFAKENFWQMIGVWATKVG